MQTVYRATSLSDANVVREVLVSRGIAVHVSIPAHLNAAAALGAIRVCVDNVKLDAARRAIIAWLRSDKNGKR